MGKFWKGTGVIKGTGIKEGLVCSMYEMKEKKVVSKTGSSHNG